jgi:acyl-coenzyme A thioesterase PaaI-like protein
MCSAANPFGLKLAFKIQSDASVFAMFACREILQGYPETLHGGIISAALDAAMTNALFSIGVVAVTAEFTVRFLAPVILNQGALVRASIAKATSHRLYYVRSEVEQDRKVMARASAKFVVKDGG